MYGKLFHKDVYLPEWLRKQCLDGQKTITGFKLSRHVIGHCESREDRSHDYTLEGVMKCLETLKSNPRDPFEVEFGKDRRLFGDYGWFVAKQCVRIPYGDGSQDLCVALSPNYREGNPSEMFVKTAWLNSNSDGHSTLASASYVTEDEWFRSI